MALAPHNPSLRGEPIRFLNVQLLIMTRSDLIAALASRFPNLMAADAQISVTEILDAIGKTMANGDRVEIRGFGSFTLNYRPTRTARNPKTGESVQTTAKHVPHFKPGKEMRELVEQSVAPPKIKRAA